MSSTHSAPANTGDEPQAGACCIDAARDSVALQHHELSAEAQP